MKLTKNIRNDKERDAFVQSLSKFDFVKRPMTFTYEDYKSSKTREQENKYHAMIREISRSIDFAGELRGVEFWKKILMSAFRKEQGNLDIQVYAGLRGEAVPMGLSTSELKAGEASDFIEFIYSEFPDMEWPHDEE